MVDSGVLDPAVRRIPLDGPVNFRDIGGYRGAGGRSVRWRQVFRADGLESMTQRDVDTVVGHLSVRTVIDLRTPREIDIVGVGPLGETDVVRRNLSIIDETQQAWQDALNEGDIMAQYLVMLDGSAGKFIEALTIMADSQGALVFHCAAGKDRTGLLAALLLSVLGVSQSDINADYALTAEVLPALTDRWRARAEDPRFREQFERRPNWRAAAARILTADGDTLGQVMLELGRQSGSPQRWLLDRGLETDVVDRLRDRLLA